MKNYKGAAVLAYLCECFPKCFNLDNPRPLKIAIDVDLRARRPPEIHPLAIGAVLFQRYIDRLQYYQCCQAGRERIDLDGNPVGVVTEAEAAYARACVERKHDERRKSEQEEAELVERRRLKAIEKERRREEWEAEQARLKPKRPTIHLKK